MSEPENGLSDIVELRRCANEDYANRYIAKGWRLLNQFKEERGTFGSFGIVYILGRPKSVEPDPAPEYTRHHFTQEDIERAQAFLREGANPQS